MPRYRVLMEYTTDVYTEVESDNIVKAMKMVDVGDYSGGLFCEDPIGDFHVYDAYEVEELNE